MQLAYLFTGLLSLLSLFVKVYFDEVKVPVENVLGGKRKSAVFLFWHLQQIKTISYVSSVYYPPRSTIVIFFCF